MPISAIVFSRDRGAQLELLLTSLESNAPGLFDPIHVLWRASGEEYEQGYGLCADAHPGVAFLHESAFAAQVDRLIEHPSLLTFFTDDSVFFRPVAERSILPDALLEEDDEILCFSLRLGRNCDTCYPLGRPQRLPAFEPVGADALKWSWRGADGDFGYPGSLDGHVFRSETVRDLVLGRDHTNPNTLEELIATGIAGAGRPAMASYRESHLVGLPVNRVNETHPNRFGESWPYGTNVLNERFLGGERLDPASLPGNLVTGAHAELPLRWTVAAG